MLDLLANYLTFWNGALALVLIGSALILFRTLKGSKPKRTIQNLPGPFFQYESIKLEHEHPTGWGDGAVIRTIKSLPKLESVTPIIRDLQTQGFAVVENMYEDLCCEKLTYEVAGIIHFATKKHAEENSQMRTLTVEPGPVINGVIHSLSNVLLDQLNIALKEYNSKPHEKTAYTHGDIEFCEFAGFNAKQLRLRLSGPGLDTHVDRASAKLTVLYYLNDCTDGEIILYALPEDKRKSYDPEIFKKDGGLGLMKELLPVKVVPKLNRLVVFWSDSIPHEVLHISSDRLSFQVFISAK